MKVFLMYREQDFDLQRPLPPNEQVLSQDLELDTLFQAMARGDDFLYKVAKSAVLSSTTDLDTIQYRQDVLKDCLQNEAVVRQIYQIPIEAMENKRKYWRGIFSTYPGGILSGALDMLQMFVELLKKLKRIADEESPRFTSAGFTRFFAMIRQELNDDYFAVVQAHLKELKFVEGVLLSAVLGKGNEGMDYVLRKPNGNNQGWMERLITRRPPSYSFRIHPRDQAGSRALADLKDRGINLVANALAQSSDHIESFMNMLRVELAFYVGCLNLSAQLAQLREPTAFPVAAAAHERQHSFEELYDICLALTMKQKVVGNTVSADGKELVIVTGANQGGKSTFLRSIGLAQLMMQCGLFVPARSFSANVCAGLFSHFKREEDVTMESGKWDEELQRMSWIVDQLQPDAMLLFNESFAATNEREGSEIARQIVRALLDEGVKVFFVTHLYDFAQSFYDRGMANALFLRAERQADGVRTFRLIEGRPLETSFGMDLYRTVFGANGQTPHSARQEAERV